jgi:hypothetical protein
MIIQRDSSPERDREIEQMRARMYDVDSFCLVAETALYTEFGHIWGQPTEAVRPVQGTASIIDEAFLRSNIDTETSQLASGRAITAAQRSVSEAYDEFSA